MGNENPFNKEPLYCFKFDPEDMEWTRYEIIDYKRRDWGSPHYSPKIMYSFDKPQIGCEKITIVPAERIDKFLHNKVYTFTNNLDYAQKIAFDTIQSEMYLLKKKYKKLQNRIESLPQYILKENGYEQVQI